MNLTNSKDDNFLPVWSPDGRHLAFLSDRDGNGQARLWVWETRTNNLRRISDLDVRGDQIEWTPDGRKVVVTSVPDGVSLEEYVETFSGGAGKNLMSAKASGLTVTLYRAKGIAQKDKEEVPLSDPWSLDSEWRDLAVVDVTSGEAKKIVRGQRIARFLISPNGEQVAYTSPTRFERPGSQQILYKLITTTLVGVEQQVVASDVRLGFTGEFSWSTDSSQISYRTIGMEEKINDCYVIDLRRGNPRKVTALRADHAPGTISQRTLWDKTSENIYFVNDGALWRAAVNKNEAIEVAHVPDRQIVQMVSESPNLLWTLDGGRSTIVLTHDTVGKQDGFYRVDLTSGESKKLLEDGQCYSCSNLKEGQFTALTRDGRRIAYFAEDAQRSSDLWISDTGFANSQRLTHLNPQFDKSKMGAIRLIDWLSDDGERLHGALLLPSNYRQGKQYPLIVFVYGGASLSDFFDHFGWYGFNLQLFATRGYAVLLPDAPQHPGTPMIDLAKSVLPGVNKVIEMGIADPNRLGLMGHSYGGYSTFALIVQTTRFKAAVEADGPGDIVGFYGEMDGAGLSYGSAIAEQGQGLMGGSPWQFRTRYIENSPIFYLDRIDTPVLIVHGSKDSAVAAFLGDEMFVGLRRLGKEVEYARYEGEDHSPLSWSYANQVDFWKRVVAWFDKYLKAASPQQNSFPPVSTNVP
jgi:dipeptidyl aminopeptidase/acylaminoacyl peptidase